MFLRNLLPFLLTIIGYFSAIASEDITHSDTFLLRLGSCPPSTGTSYYQKADNSYEAWSSGWYRSIIEKCMPLRNVVHNYYVTELGVTPRSDGDEFLYNIDINLDGLSGVIADFNTEKFDSDVAKLTGKLGNKEGKFDLIITDFKTSKFVLPAGLSRILSKQKVNGCAIFTDIDEPYERDYDGGWMFKKQTKAAFQLCPYDPTIGNYANANKVWASDDIVWTLGHADSISEESPNEVLDDLIEFYGLSKDSFNKLKEKWSLMAESQKLDHTRYGLFDLVFGDCPEDGEVDSKYLKDHQINVADGMKFKVNIYTMHQFYKLLNAGTCLLNCSKKLQNVVNYLMRLGNPDLIWNNRVVVIERIE